jgi:hypothetical protein
MNNEKIIVGTVKSLDTNWITVGSRFRKRIPIEEITFTNLQINGNPTTAEITTRVKAWCQDAKVGDTLIIPDFAQ